MMTDQQIPLGYCQCGCGERTTIANRNDRSRGIVKGQPVRFVNGSHARWLKRKQWQPLEHPTDPTKALIPLTKGLTATVDRSDLPILVGKTWTAKESCGDCLYGITSVEGKHVHMHHLILGIVNDRENLFVDHVDRNGLNNSRENLRVGTKREISGNQGLRVSNSSGYKGIWFDRPEGQWRAQIRVDGHSTDFGGFYTKEEAALAYDRAARRVFGKFARLNFPEEGELSAR